MYQIKWKVSGTAVPEARAHGVDLFNTRDAAERRVKTGLKALREFDRQIVASYVIVDYCPMGARLEKLEEALLASVQEVRKMRIELQEKEASK